MEGAFRNAASLVIVQLPDTLASIGNNAFNACSSLQCININGDVTISDSTFANVNSGLTIYGTADSTVAAYCANKGIAFSADPLPWPTVTISSRITEDYDGLSGVTVKWYLDGDTSQEPAAAVTTNALGKWTYSGALCGRTYRITYEKAGYDFSTYNLTYTVGWENGAVQNINLE